MLLGNNPPAVRGPLAALAVSQRLALTTTILTYGLLLSGSNVRGNSADLVCPGWPLCGRDNIPASVMSLVEINLFHRVVAGIVGLFIIATIIYAWRRRREAPRQAAIAIAAAILFAIQVTVGAPIVLLGAPHTVVILQASIWRLARPSGGAPWPWPPLPIAIFLLKLLPSRPLNRPPQIKNGYARRLQRGNHA